MVLVLAGNKIMDGIQLEESVAVIHGSASTDKVGVEYIVAYAKFVECKDNGSELSGVFFGGVGCTQEQAEIIARDCVNAARGGYILPKIVELTGPHQVIEALYDVEEQFEKLQKQMVECHSTIARTNSRKKK